MYPCLSVANHELTPSGTLAQRNETPLALTVSSFMISSGDRRAAAAALLAYGATHRH